MKQIKSISAIILLATVSLNFIACDKEESNESIFGNSSITVINAKVENGESYNSTIKFVKAMITTPNDNDFVVGTGTYSNGGFTIELPATVNEQYLYPISLIAGVNNSEKAVVIKNDIKISNPNVKGITIGDFYGLEKDTPLNENFGRVISFNYDTRQPNKNDRFHTWGIFIYVNGDVTITGSAVYDNWRTMNIVIFSLKKVGI